MANTVDKVITIAKAEVGYLEKSASAYKKNPAILDKKTDGAGSDNYTKYGRDMHKVYPSVMDFPAYWCDAFVDWCFYKAYGVTTAKSLLGGNFDDYTVASASMYDKKGGWHKASETPKIGDQIFFVRAGKKQEIKNICHTGIVYKVTSSRVYTIEGNTSGGSTVVPNGGGVAYKDYPLNYNRIAGYGRPKYDTSTTLSSTTSTSSKTTSTTTKTSSSTSTSKLKITSNIKSIQTWLNTYYKTGLVVDGVYGSKTKAALVKAWQTEVGGLTVDGIFGTKSKTASASHIIKKGSTGILVTIWQAYLVCRGYNPNGIDGSFGTGCNTATIAFQKANKLTQDGQVGKNTWTKAFA